ncbi:SNF2-related protein [Thermoanaerobacterium sp. DL9XJH110]|uniref:SNF2-related protein n=1 Tax=Thermoanaerobacterium sp. DL9XJH110 TaxID=3386643 RepID=UPI003BB4C3E6
MKFIPHTYQKYAIQRILEQPAVGLFLDMGMGKTVCALTAAAELLHDRFEVTRVLVIAPLRVAEDTWSREAEKWDHLKYLRIAKVLGSEQQRVAALNSDADIYVINRENVEWLVNYFGKRWPFDMVIIDELSSFKSSKARRFRALRKVRPLIKRIMGLTGTPAPNGLIDLWAQIYLLDQGERLGKTITGYRERYFEPDKRSRTVIYSWKPKPGAEKAIFEKLSDICVSMRAEDWLEMPERIDRVIPVQLPQEAQEQYKRLERDLLLPFADGDIVANTAAVLSNKLLQMANGAVYDENRGVKVLHNTKLEVLEEIIEAANGKPVLVFYAYRHDLDRLKAYFPKARTLDTAKDINDWNSGKIPILLAHPASAGHGLNLQAGGHIIVWFGLVWSLELYQQANARLCRQGQTHSVIVHHLVAEGTIDEDVMKALSNKVKGQDALLEAVKARIEKYQKEMPK